MGKSFLLLQTVTIFNRFKTQPNSTCEDSFKHAYITVLLPLSSSFSICEQPAWFSSHGLDTQLSHWYRFLQYCILTPPPINWLPDLPTQSADTAIALSCLATSQVTSTLSNAPKFSSHSDILMTVPCFCLELGSDYIGKHRPTNLFANVHHWRDLFAHLPFLGLFLLFVLTQSMRPSLSLTQF